MDPKTMYSPMFTHHIWSSLLLYCMLPRDTWYLAVDNRQYTNASYHGTPSCLRQQYQLSATAATAVYMYSKSRSLREKDELEASPIVSASDREPLASSLGSSNSLFRPLSLQVASPGLRQAYSARALSGSCAAAEHGEPELRSFRQILRTRRNVSRFYFLIRPWRIVLLLLRSPLVAEFRDLFDLSGSRPLPLHLDYLPLRITLALIDPIGLACFGTRLAGCIEGYEYCSVRAAAAVYIKKKADTLVSFRFNSIILILNTASTGRKSAVLQIPGRNTANTRSMMSSINGRSTAATGSILHHEITGKKTASAGGIRGVSSPDIL